MVNLIEELINLERASYDGFIGFRNTLVACNVHFRVFCEIVKDKVAVQINCPVMSFHSYDDGSGGATIELENSN